MQVDSRLLRKIAVQRAVRSGGDAGHDEVRGRILQAALRLTHPGSLIIADNVVRRGVIPVAGEEPARALAVQHFNAALAAETRVAATILPLAGSKGFDGMALAVVR